MTEEGIDLMIAQTLGVVSQLVDGQVRHTVRGISEHPFSLVTRSLRKASLTTDVTQVIVHVERQLQTFKRLQIHKRACHKCITICLTQIQISQFNRIEFRAKWSLFIVVIDQVTRLIFQILTRQQIMPVNRIDRSNVLGKAGTISIRITEGTRRLGVSMDQTT